MTRRVRLVQEKNIFFKLSDLFIFVSLKSSLRSCLQSLIGKLPKPKVLLKSILTATVKNLMFFNTQLAIACLYMSLGVCSCSLLLLLTQADLICYLYDKCCNKQTTIITSELNKYASKYAKR